MSHANNLIRGNFFNQSVTGPNPDQEIIENLFISDQVRVEKITSTGHTTPDGKWYDQDEDEWVMLVSGEASLTFDNGEVITLKPGDYLLIPAHQRHMVTYTSADPPALWLAIFYKPLHHD